ncbi:DUF6624 domain-containing protein [Chryseobacterium daecheongense]|uniref:Uncharacterized protein n=1 Tax=Chryseobacterium daecheongense TaxID=192389 RepID=A0A3N0VRX6_9FLAO|nr:DUF6624 domain-containing protein [Chryseobacterium daecheongense]ROH95562.1 hypothetical protein EGI05_13585 [Chryseobacterium daecheongense]TDX92063.1 hypothetical protein BCF50_3205 [Chryseobacterium daecheongense]
MKYLFFTIFFSVLINSQKIQDQSINIQLKKELAQIDKDDQIYREFMLPDTSPERRKEIIKEKNLTQEEATVGLGKKMDQQDAENLAKIEKIIAKYGYPGKSLVGEPENKTAWLVIQHSPKINQYLPLIKKAAEEKELPFRLYAMMLDRQLVQEDKEQIYGTQARSFTTTKDGKTEMVWIIWPIKDFINVNRLREEAGFGQTVQDYAQGMLGKDFVFKNYTLEEALQLQNRNKK